MERYREERKPTMRKQKNTMRSRMIRSEGLAVHFEHNLSTTGPHVAISIKENLKKGLR